MAEDTIQVGHVGGGNEVLLNMPSPMTPFQKGAVIMFEKYIKDTDFTDGNDLVLEIPGISKAFVIGISDVGAIKAHALATSTDGTGLKVTFSAVTTNLTVLIITDV